MIDPQSALQRAAFARARGQWTRAARAVEQAIIGFEASVGPRHPHTAYARVERAWLWMVRGEVIRGAREIITATGMLVRALDGCGHAARILLAAAAGLREAGAYREARRCARRALAVADHRAFIALAHNELGMIGKLDGRFADAELHYRKALALYRRLGAGPAEMAMVLHNLGGLAHARGDYARGEPYARRAVDIVSARLPPDDPERLAHEVAHAALLDGLGRYAESAAIYRRALAIYRRTCGRLHVETVSTLHNLAAAEHALGHRAVALRLHRESARLHEQLLGRSHPDLALALFNLAVVEQARDPKAAAMHARRALGIFSRRLGARHPHTRAAIGFLRQRSRINGKPSGRSRARSSARQTTPG